MTILHTIGQPFRRHGYELEDLTATMRLAHEANGVWFMPETTIRMSELSINPIEVDRICLHGEVIAFEVSPWLKELRLELKYNRGDAANLHPVIWLDTNYSLCCADIRA